VAVLENREVARTLTRNDGLSSEVILRSIPDEKTGGVFLVTSNGLCYMNPDETVRTLDNFPYYNNYDIWIQDTDRLFVLSSAGIYVTDRAELLSGKKDIKYDLLDTRRGLNSSLTANAWTWYTPETGELYLAADTGAFVLNTGKLSSGSKVYRMSVPSARMDGVYRRVDRNSPVTVPRGVGKLELSPEIINYTIQDPYVGYKMEGFDTDWVIMPQNSLSSIVYTNLPAGEYTFHLAVFDNNRENILAERTYSIVKEKEMYDNPWFILYVLTVPMFTVGWITWLLVKRREVRMERELAEANRMVEMGKQTVKTIARAVDAKDPRTGGHSRRVALYSRQMAKEYGLSEKDCQDIDWAASLHDIGKIAIPDRILNKDSRLTDEEYAMMKSHTMEGAKILSDFTFLDHVTEGAEYHHERVDGRGYPKGLKGEEIPLYARIIGVADAFDAMTANRVYRKQMDFGYVLGELEKGRGTQFDAQFVDILLKLIRNGTIDMNKLYGVNPEEIETKPEEAAPESKQEESKQEAGNSTDAK
jgi:energy-coupling factor transport system substrate-specific component